jgi:hypothetical protein
MTTRSNVSDHVQQITLCVNSLCFINLNGCYMNNLHACEKGALCQFLFATTLVDGSYMHMLAFGFHLKISNLI